MLDWPSNSPDLNPIEHVWKLLKDKVKKKNIYNTEDFKKIILNEWKAININIINSLINSMQNRINEVIKNNGNNTSY